MIWQKRVVVAITRANSNCIIKNTNIYYNLHFQWFFKEDIDMIMIENRNMFLRTFLFDADTIHYVGMPQSNSNMIINFWYVVRALL